MDEQEEKYDKQADNQNKETARQMGKNRIIGKIVNFIGKKKLFIIGIIILAVILVLLLLAGSLYVLDKNKFEDAGNAKKQAITTSYSPNTSITQTDDAGNTINKVAVNMNENKNTYEFLYNKDSENIEKIKRELSGSSISGADFTEFELAVIGAFLDNGADLEYYTEEQLKCLPIFIKAESATKNLDLRPNSEKIVNGEYKLLLIEDLEENEIPGVILVQRTNTNSTAPTILEYKKYNDFMDIKDGKNGANPEDAINYFTLNDNGNLVIAKWNKVNTQVSIIKDNLPNDIKTELQSQNTNGDEYTITTEEIAYNQYVNKYTMPFEFLLQLLIVTDEPDFCMELVNHALNSKIVINIQEEETFTVTDETRNYTVHDKDNKYISYKTTTPSQQIIEQNNNYFFSNMLDDTKKVECTNYSDSNSVVKIHTEYTSHSYVFEITEVDTWYAHYIKTYTKQERKDEPTSTTNTQSNGEYERVNSQTITDETSINVDKDVSTFIYQKEAYSAVDCTVSSLKTESFRKINLNTNVATTVTKHPSDPNPTTKTHIYATESETPGYGYGDKNTVYEKFLVALNNSKNATNCLNSIDLWLFEMMEKDESTVELVDIIKYLLYMYDGKSRGVTELKDFETIFNPGEFVSASSGGNISLTTPILSREDFIKAMEEYNGGTNFDQNFKSRAAEIYDLGIKYGVNPELVVTMAKKEGNFKPAGGQNYWGLDTPNGSAAAYFPTFESGVKRLAEIFKTYMPGGKYANLITRRKNERSAANCNTNGYGDPGTLKGMLSVYSDLCGSNTKHREGNWGSGGNIYLKEIYGSEFEKKCGNIHKISVDDYTLQEKADYTAWLYENQITYWIDIFGNYGSISSGGDFLEKALEVWNIVSKTGSGYTYGGSRVPCTGTKIDCSSYVSWVLLNYGYTGFEGSQTTTYGFYHTNWNKKYGWEEIYINGGENATSKLQPGDIYVRRGASNGHVCIIVEIKDGKVYGYDCGATSNWKNRNGNTFNVTWFTKDSRPGKIIRVTPPQS